MREFDLAVFYAINRWPEGLSPFFFFMSESNKWLPMRLFLLGLFISMLLHPRSRNAAIYAVVSWPLANELTDILKAGFRGMRPSAELADAIIRVDRLTSFGTASAHSANMAAVATAMTYFLGWKWGSIWILVAFFTGLSRIYVGVHYPYQVLFGWFCGFAVAMTVIKIGEAIGRWRKASRGEGPEQSSDRDAPASPSAPTQS